MSPWTWARTVSFTVPCNAQNGPPQGPPQLPPGIIYEDLHLVPAFAKAHGLVMGIAFTIVFPLGAILLRVIRSKFGVRAHIVSQLLGYVLMIAGLATGIRVGKILDRVGLSMNYCNFSPSGFVNSRSSSITTAIRYLVPLSSFSSLSNHSLAFGTITGSRKPSQPAYGLTFIFGLDDSFSCWESSTAVLA